MRVLRGGSWLYGPSNARAADRNLDPPDYRGSNVGFRLARTLAALTSAAGKQPTAWTTAPATVAPQPPRIAMPTLPSAEDIHGWPAAKVQVLQKVTAGALALPMVFRDRLKDGGEGPELVLIPPGSFLMGVPRDDECWVSAGPQHRVTIARPFALGRYAVTFEEYDAFCAATARDKPNDAGWGRGRQPVIYVSWDVAAAYCRWLSDQTGQEYRLPSEAEWEYGCRAGTATPFHFGAKLSTAQANYDGRYSSSTFGSGGEGEERGRPIAVGSLPANPWGLYEVHGNVLEWCEDCWNDRYYTSAPTDGSAWRHGDGKRRILRGGSWTGDPRSARSDCRAMSDVRSSTDWWGFRVARTLPSGSRAPAREQAPTLQREPPGRQSGQDGVPRLERGNQAGALAPRNQATTPAAVAIPPKPAGRDTASTYLPPSTRSLGDNMWDEIGTKLDLGRAYVEMNDLDAAQAILSEVIEEGNADQQQEARGLLVQLKGH